MGAVKETALKCLIKYQITCIPEKTIKKSFVLTQTKTNDKTNFSPPPSTLWSEPNGKFSSILCKNLNLPQNGTVQFYFIL